MDRRWARCSAVLCAVAAMSPWPAFAVCTQSTTFVGADNGGSTSDFDNGESVVFTSIGADRLTFAGTSAQCHSHSGAITCSELAATGTAAVLVPSPNVTADHQTRNARALSNAGAAVLLHEDDLHERFSEVVPPLLGDAARLVEMEASARALARPDAAQRIAHRVLELAGAHATAPEAAFV